VLNAFLPLQQIDFVHIHRFFVAEEGDQNSKSYSRFGRCVSDYEDGKYLAMQSPQSRERHEV
jgi:hypothetical protein